MSVTKKVISAVPPPLEVRTLLIKPAKLAPYHHLIYQQQRQSMKGEIRNEMLQSDVLVSNTGDRVSKNIKGAGRDGSRMQLPRKHTGKRDSKMD